MKNSKIKLTSKRRKQPPQPRTAVPHEPLVKHKADTSRFVRFSQVKGRTLNRVEFYTALDHHSLTLFFQDKTALTLVIEPCFLVAANLSDLSMGDQRILRRWPAIRSVTEKA